jgi:hypothetical protein
MINIQNSQIVYYGKSQQTTVFGDYDDPNKYYIVPEPRVVHMGGVPQFSLVRYEKTDGKVAGRCSFDVELYVPGEARIAAQQQIGQTVNWGQFDWVGVETYFIYDVLGESRMQPGSASMYGSNRSTFLIDLASDEEVETFIGAFKGTDGGVSPFRVEYDATVLTTLPAVTATVNYVAQIAIDYETQYETEEDMWGNTSYIAVGVKQNLQQSGAGKVDIEWAGTPPSQETQQFVRDWGMVTLEKLVTDSLTTAMQMSGGRNPVALGGDFTRVYTENQIVEWTFITNNPLPKYGEEDWKQVFTIVDSRELVINFGLLGELTKPDGGAVLERVDVTVDYPTRTTGNTFSLRPQDGSSFVYKAPGYFPGGVFAPDYRYKYKVIYTSGAPYESDFIDAKDTSIAILPSELGIRQVTFVGSSIPFQGDSRFTSGNATTVTGLTIDFFFQRPAGEPNIVQSKTMTKNGTDGKVVFDSLFNLPLNNTYTYRLTYQMSDGSIYVVAPTDSFGTQSKDLVMVLNPFQEQTFTIRAMVPKTSGGTPNIQYVYLDADYIDKGYQTSPSYTFDWDLSETGSKGTVETAYKPKTGPKWSFLGISNPEGAYFKLNGDITYDDGNFSVNNLKVQALRSQILLDPREETYSVTVDGRNIDWGLIKAIRVTLLQGDIDPESLTLKKWLTNRRTPNAPAVLNVTNSYEYPLLQAVDTSIQEEYRYFLINRPRDEKSIVFYYTAQYIYADGTVKTIDQAEVKDKFTLVLPRNGDTEGFNLVRHEITFEEAETVTA